MSSEWLHVPSCELQKVYAVDAFMSPYDRDNLRQIGTSERLNFDRTPQARGCGTGPS